MERVTKAPSLTEQATTSLRKGILDGTLKVDQVYSATELGLMLGVSRTPIREALLELERRGLVRIEKNKGARILSTSISTLIEVFQIRLMLEIPLSRRSTQLATPESRAVVERAHQAFRMAAESGDAVRTLKVDRDFHSALLTGASNSKAKILLQEQRDFVLSTGVGTVPQSRSTLECFHDHDDIMSAYRDNDIDGVGIAVGRHIANTARILIAQETGTPQSVNDQIRADLEWYIH